MFFFFKQKTAYEMRISDWSSDVCSSDLLGHTGLTADPLMMMNFIRRPVPAPHPDDGQFPEHGGQGIPAAGRICHGEKAGRGFWRVHQHPKYIPITATSQLLLQQIGRAHV